MKKSKKPMKPRVKWWVPSEPFPPYLKLKPGEDTGLSDAIVDTAFWLHDRFDNPIDEAWFSALEKVDKTHDLQPIIKQLKRFVPAELYPQLEKVDKTHGLQPIIQQLKKFVPAELYPHLADLSRRYTLKGRRGRPQTPSYDRTPPDRVLELGLRAVRERVDNKMRVNKMRVEAAIEDVHLKYDIPFNLLKDFYQGRRRSTQQMKKRRR